MVEQVFISHSIKDKGVADAVCERLEATGIKCWIAPRDILPGNDWSEAIIDAIGSSRLMVLIHSESANHSIQIKREVERAVSKGVVVVPVRIEDVEVSKPLEYYLSTAYWLDAVSPPLEPHLEYLSTMVEHHLNAAKPLTEADETINCGKCGKQMQNGAASCEVCGWTRTEDTHQPLPRAPAYTPAKPAGLRRFWPKSRAAKISLGAALIALVIGITTYFFMFRQRSNAASVEAYIMQADGHLRMSEFDRAIEIYSEAIKLDPANAFGWRGRGVAYASRGFNRNINDDYDRAINDFGETLSRLSNDDYSYAMRGWVYSLKKMPDRALQDYDAAVKLNPNNAFSFAGRGSVYFMKEEYDLALANYSQALKIFPSAENYFYRGNTQLKKGDYRAAVSDFSEAIALNSSNFNLYKSRSYAYYKLGEREKAIADDKQASLLTPAQSQPSPHAPE